MPRTGTTETGQIDRDGDHVPDVCDNCVPPPAGTIDPCTGITINPLRFANNDQADANHDGIGDRCDPDRDCDSVPDFRDNCPPPAIGNPRVSANTDQHDCHATALTTLNDRERRVGLPLTPARGDVCDPQPCPSIDVTLMPGTDTLTFQTLRVDAVASVPTNARTGFRFCRCDGIRSGDLEALRACQRAGTSPFSGNCPLVNDTVVPGMAADPALTSYDNSTERHLVGSDPILGVLSPWRWMTLEESGTPTTGLAPTPRASVSLRYDLAQFDTRGAPSFALVANWNIFPRTRGPLADTVRWTALPAAPSTGESESFAGVLSEVDGIVWAQVEASTVGGFDRELADTYFDGSFTPPILRVAQPPSDLFRGLAALISSGGWWGQLPFIGGVGPPGCDTPPNCGIAIRVADVTIPPTAPQLPDLSLFQVAGNWFGASEPSGQLDASPLRYVALGPDMSLSARIFETPAGMASKIPSSDYAELPVSGPTPPPADAVDVLSVRRGQLFHLENGQPAHLWVLDVKTGRWDVHGAPDLGYVRAAVYSATDDLIYAVDEVPRRGRSRERRRLVAISPDSGVVVPVGEYPRSRQIDRFALAIDASGALYLATSSSRSDEHHVARLRATLGGLSVLGVREGRGVVVSGLARADDRGVAVLVERRGDQYVESYSRGTFRSPDDRDHRDDLGLCL
jgi:hypothetical protein